MIDGICAHGEALTDACAECNDAAEAKSANRPACPLGVTANHFCDAITCNTPIEQLRREAVVSRDLTRRFHAVASKHVAMLWSLDAAQAVEKLLGLLIDHGAVLGRFVSYAKGKGPSIDTAYVDILDDALALIQRTLRVAAPSGDREQPSADLSVTEQSYRLQCAALEKTVADLRGEVSRLRGEEARLDAAVKDRDAMIHETMVGYSQRQVEVADLECEADRLRGSLSAAEAERDEANRLLSEMTEALHRTVDQRDAALESPVPLILFCPECVERHIDAGEFAEKPHHTHACQSCGFVWRPAVVATVGVRFLPGFRDADERTESSRFGMSEPVTQ